MIADNWHYGFMCAKLRINSRIFTLFYNRHDFFTFRLSHRHGLLRYMDVTAQETIFRQRYLPLHRLLFREALSVLGNSEDAADAVQDAMCRIWSDPERMTLVEKPKSYAVTILRNAAVDRLRKRRPSVDLENVEIAAHNSGEPDDTVFIRNAIGSLGDSYRAVMEMSAFDGLSIEEISVATGYSQMNVRQILCRARRKIKEIINKEWL